MPLKLSVLPLAALFAAAALPAQQTLLATPTTVAWGYYSAKAKPVYSKS